MRSITSILRSLPLLLVGTAQARRLVYRIAGAGKGVEPEQKRTVVLGAGISAEELAQELYKQDIRAGGWLCDIGLWHGLYIRRAAEVINEEAAQHHGQMTNPPSADDC